MADDPSSPPRSFGGLLRSLPPRALLNLREDFNWRITGRWVVYAAAVGIVGALGAAAFAELVRLTSNLTLVHVAGYHAPMPGGEAEGAGRVTPAEGLVALHRWWLLVIPTVGGLLSGWIVFTFAPEAEGHGTDSVIEAFHQKDGRIRKHVPIVKTVASAITLGTGGSAGREGPIAQIGASFGSLLSDWMGLNARQRRMLLVAGIAAGISSIFRSPLGGAFFAVEVLYKEDLETEALMPAVVAGIIGYSTYTFLERSSAVFVTPEFSLVNPLALLLVIVFALGCVVAGYVYVRIFYRLKDLFHKIPLPPHVKPAIGGLLVGGIAFFFPAVLGSGYGWLQFAIDGKLSLTIMLVLAVTKIFATSFTISSGGSGGVFAPSLVIGGMLGGLFGVGMQHVLPAIAPPVGAFVIIGMATFFAGVANVPIATTVMISELTGRYVLLIPIIFGSVIAHLVSRSWSIYQEQVATHRDSPVHSSELTTDLLSAVTVESVIERSTHFHTLAPSHTLDEMLDVFTRTRDVILPVRAEQAEAAVDESSAAEEGGVEKRVNLEGDGAAEKTDQKEKQAASYSGLVLLEDVQSLLQSNEMMRHLVVAYDVEVPFAAVHLVDTLDDVLETFVETQYPELPVLDEKDEIVAFVRQGQVINEYHRAYLRNEAEAKEAKLV